MAKILRYAGNVKAFGSNATGTDRTVFGDVTQSDLLNDNLNASFLTGWGILAAGAKPPKEYFNGALFTATQLISYLFQQGIPEWDSAQEFNIGSISFAASGLIVRSKTNSNIGNDPATDTGTNWEQALLTGIKNKIINGNPLINQRSYVSGTATTIANQYTLDRWRIITLGQALTFSTIQNVTTMTLPIGGIEQVIEGSNLQSKTYTISFVATGDTVCTVDAVAKSSGDTFTAIGGTDVTVKFSSALGTGTVKLIQVEEGSVATNFEYRDYGAELSLCQRYFEKNDYVTKATTGVESEIYKVTKRVAPSISLVLIAGAGTFSAININIEGFRIIGDAVAVDVSWTADAEI